MHFKFESAAAFILLLTCVGPGTGQLSAATDFEIAQNEGDVTEQQKTPDAKGEEKKSKWGNFLVLPIIITEPAIGEGLGASLIYFHGEKEGADRKVTTGREFGKTGKRAKPPPTATGIFGFYTNDDSAAAGIGHTNSFLNDTYRIVAAAADARINSTFYVKDTPFNFSLDGNIVYANLKRRLGDSNAFFGITASHTDAAVNFKSNLQQFDGISLDDFDFVDAGVAASLIHDSRDNTLMPNSGHIVDLTTWRYDQALGGDFDYSSTHLKALSYRKLGQHYVLGLRLAISQANGDVPFYAKPYVRLRGIPALRYQGNKAGAIELEARRRFGERWSVSVFSGVGAVEVRLPEVETSDNINTLGVGLRYLALKEQDAWVGVDIAGGPENVAWYIQMGNAW